MKPVKKSAPKATPAKKLKFCANSGCKSAAASQGYCRLHYLENWRTIKLSKQIKAENRLNHYVEKLSEKYPESFMEKIKEGLANEDKFLESVEELDIEPKEAVKETDDEFLEKFLRVVKPEH